MRVNDRIASGVVLILVLLQWMVLPAHAKPVLGNKAAVFSAIDFVPNIETMGVAVSGTGLPSTAELSYRKGGDVVWQTGHPLVRVPDGRLIGSLFDFPRRLPMK